MRRKLKQISNLSGLAAGSSRRETKEERMEEREREREQVCRKTGRQRVSKSA